MNLLKHRGMWVLPAIVTLSLAFHVAHARDQGKSSYMKVDITEAFASIMARMQAAKPDIERRHSDLLSERYDLSDRPARGVMMERNLHLDWLAWVSTNLAIRLGSPSEMFSGCARSVGRMHRVWLSVARSLSASQSVGQARRTRSGTKTS
jgi:hypothetical protein